MKGPEPPKQEKYEEVNKSKLSSATGVNASGLSNIKPVSVGLDDTEDHVKSKKKTDRSGGASGGIVD